ncbi:MAG: pyruvate ferredoxin oxidoreductase [Calditrichaeota bacterium]|nr:pyruvate ferredoxin oxidoreductase [Calditrichota bacterium]
MQKVLTGNQSAAWGAMCAKAQVVSAYPITPQTTVIEELAELVAKGMLDAKFIKVESEHSAMAGCIGAQATGARTFTATSSQGLALMHEELHWAGLARLPIVMANINRAMAPGWSIWTDQNDSLSQRDTGWLQFYCESNQEVLDTTIQSYKIAETVNLPVMLILDAFFLSHTYEAIDIPSQEETLKYLPPYKPSIFLDVNDPHAFGGILPQDYYMEFRYKMQVAMDEALDVAVKADEDFKAMFGRGYGVIDQYRMDDADIILVTSGTVASTTRAVIDDLQAKGQSVGMLKMKMLRPFPADLVREALAGRKRVAVLDRNICPGMGGIWTQEIRNALYHMPEDKRPPIYGYILGLGGRDVTPEVIEKIAFDVQERPVEDGEQVWIGLKE